MVSSRSDLLFIGLLAVLVTGGISFSETADDRPLPNVLIIGDSISIGYTQPLTEMLKGKANVVHNPGNAQHSGYGLAHLEEWLGETHWDVVHFNHGLHDLKYVDANGKNTRSKEEGHIQVPLDRYRRNMEAIVLRLKKTGAKPIFATTTPFPDKPDGPLREADQVERYNAVALEIMKENDVALNDLCAFALPRLKELQRPNNVHFTPEGSEVLAREVARHVLQALGAPTDFLDAGTDAASRR